MKGAVQRRKSKRARKTARTIGDDLAVTDERVTGRRTKVTQARRNEASRNRALEWGWEGNRTLLLGLSVAFVDPECQGDTPLAQRSVPVEFGWFFSAPFSERLKFVREKNPNS